MTAYFPQTSLTIYSLPSFQVTPSSFTVKDALISEGAKLVVRESPTGIVIQRVGDEGHEVTASAGEDVELECIVSGGTPPAKLK